jgi:hypothetical protein
MDTTLDRQPAYEKDPPCLRVADRRTLFGISGLFDRQVNLSDWAVIPAGPP